MNRRVKKYRRSNNKRKINLKNRSRKPKKLRSKSRSKSKSKSKRYRISKRYQRGGTTSVIADSQTTSVASDGQTNNIANVITRPSVSQTTNASARLSSPCNLLSNSNSNSNIFQDTFIEQPHASHLGANDYLYVNNDYFVHKV